MKSQSFSRQSGLTLIEMVIALSVIVLVLVLATVGFNQNSGRAQSLEAKMQLIRAGVLRFQTDLPCGPATLSALTMREDAAVGLCGDSNNLNNWRGPYIDAGSIYVNASDSDLSNILPGASLKITKEQVGSTIYTILKVSEISDEMRSAMVALCSDDCTPYKSITGDTSTVGILVSQVSFKAFNQGGNVVAFGVTPAAPSAPVVSRFAILPTPFVPPAITLPASTMPASVGQTTLLAMTPPPAARQAVPQQLSPVAALYRPPPLPRPPYTPMYSGICSGYFGPSMTAAQAVETPCDNLKVQARMNAFVAFGLVDPTTGNLVPGVMEGARAASDRILIDMAWNVGWYTGARFSAHLYTCFTIAQASAVGYAEITVDTLASMTPQDLLASMEVRRVQSWNDSQAAQASGCTSSPTNPYTG